LKTFITISILLVLAGCNPDGVGCFKSSGTIETVSIVVPEFNVIDVSGNIEVHLFNKPTKEVSLTTGSNLIPGIRMEVVDGVLFLDNLNTCNWTRNYENPVLEISNPGLTKIMQRGSGEIIGMEMLTYDQLLLENKFGSGDFILGVNVRRLDVVSNEVANFYLTGSAEELNIGFYYADEIFFGDDLQVNNCTVTHYGSNSINLNVSGSLKGTIYSFGDIILHNQLPQTVDVDELADGKLIYVP